MELNKLDTNFKDNTNLNYGAFATRWEVDFIFSHESFELLGLLAGTINSLLEILLTIGIF